VFFLHLFHRTYATAKIRELDEFLLDGLKPLLPLSVRDMRLDVIAALKSILGIQLLKLSDLRAETADLFAKHCQVIHIA
jgi:hypothetical protein